MERRSINGEPRSALDNRVAIPLLNLKMALDQAALIAEIDSVLAQWVNLRRKSKYDDHSNIPTDELVAASTLMHAAIERFAPPGSTYRENAAQAVKKYGPDMPHTSINTVAGVLTALRADYAAGRLRAVHELIHADVFGDFLDMAQYLLSENYKDPAAVIAGSVLEEHLRKLCDKNGIATVDPVSGAAKKASSMNSELRKVGAYDKGGEKNVTAWLDLRNDAAHGHYGKYLAAQVALLIASVRDFMTRHPA